jgi:hypothetical protein
MAVQEVSFESLRYSIDTVTRVTDGSERTKLNALSLPIGISHHFGKGLCSGSTAVNEIY